MNYIRNYAFFLRRRMLAFREHYLAWLLGIAWVRAPQDTSVCPPTVEQAILPVPGQSILPAFLPAIKRLAFQERLTGLPI